METSQSVQMFLHFDPGDQAFLKLAKGARRIAALLETPKVKASGQIKGCLDDLLGAIYALVFAAKEDFEHRVAKPIEADKVLIRANQLADGKVRTDGKWMAGFHLNSALFRLSATYDRILKIVVGGSGDLGARREEAECRYNWKNTNIRAIHGQATDLKHTPKGTHDGRRKDAGLQNAADALNELLGLVEAWNE